VAVDCIVLAFGDLSWYFPVVFLQGVLSLECIGQLRLSYKREGEAAVGSEAVK